MATQSISGHEQTPDTPLNRWVFAPETTLIPDDQYIDLEVLDLSEFDFLDHEDTHHVLSDNQQDVVHRAFNAFKTVGFAALKNFGLSSEQIQHQFDIGKLLNEGVPEEEKHALHARIWEGSWAGYKPKGYFKRPHGAFDSLEHYDLYPSIAIRSRLPAAAQSYLSDIRGFMEHNHFVILRRLLAVLSLGLGLDIDTLWKLHNQGDTDGKGDLVNAPDDQVDWKHTKDHLRYALYHPPAEEDRPKKKNLWLPGHTDLGSVTFIYSQPIAGLQALSQDGQWRYIRYYPNHIIADLGDCMEFLTGGILKASPHRVREPPEDQRYLDRLGIFYFVPFLPTTTLSPLDHPSLRALGAKDFFEEYYALGGKPLTQEEWGVEKSKLIGTSAVKKQKREAMDVLQDVTFRYNPT